ncbi:MAG: hypothetical protein M3Y56_06380, partial [Armatimonadota bacterium]|nr:hypothetical protein [Armatimonadota bacterium]
MLKSYQPAAVAGLVALCMISAVTPGTWAAGNTAPPPTATATLPSPTVALSRIEGIGRAASQALPSAVSGFRQGLTVRPIAPAPMAFQSPSAQSSLINPDIRLIYSHPVGRVGQMDPNRGLYPDASMVDESALLSAPAGKFGFLAAGQDGHFHWPNGERARFWGVCISRRSIMLPHAEIAQVVDVLARAGCNLVRFEALDGSGGVLSGSPTDSRHLNLPMMDTLQFWLACLRARGIYYYLDLLDFRHFYTGDGVANAAAMGIAGRPYAIFNPHLIELQQEYARQLLLAINPYTRIRLIDDPALVMVELVNEHGFFMDVTHLATLAPPYNQEFQLLWDAWLLRHYGSRAALAAHWTAANEPLLPNEDPTTGTIVFQAMPSSESGYDHGGVRSARIRDQVDFLADTQRAYFRTMRNFLRQIGLHCPITASVSSVVGPDVLSVADELDCTAENYYADHPKYAANDWAGDPYFENMNPLRTSSPSGVAPQTSVLRWNNKPVVIREWDTVWPNAYRSTSIPSMAAYASLQDLDMVVLFTYVTGPASTRLMDFGIGNDPTVWGLFGMASRIYLKGLVDTAKYQVNLLYGDYDLEQWGPYLNQLHRLAWCSLVRNVSNSAVPPPSNGISVLSGRGGATLLPPRNSLLFQRLDAVPPPDRFYATQSLLKSNRIPLDPQPLSDSVFRFDGMMYGVNEKAVMPPEAGFYLDDLKTAGYKPVGVDAEGQMAFGAYNPARNQMVLPLVTGKDALRASLDLLHVLGADASHDQVEADRWHSDTGQIVLDPGAGRLIAASPRCAIITGEWTPGETLTAGSMTMFTHNTDGSVMMESLDDRPLGVTQQWLLKMVTRAGNTGQNLALVGVHGPAPFVLRHVGTAPIVTNGAPSANPTFVQLGATPLVEVDMTGGVWELLRLWNRYLFYCDTPGVRVRPEIAGRLIAITVDNRLIPMGRNPDGSFIYPSNVLGMEILPELPTTKTAAHSLAMSHFAHAGAIA